MSKKTRTEAKRRAIKDLPARTANAREQERIKGGYQLGQLNANAKLLESLGRGGRD